MNDDPKINYVFDVDGTLTPSRLTIDPIFKDFFTQWIQNKNVYILTGSDHTKTIEQIGEHIWSSVTESHQCGGNVVYRKGHLVETSTWEPSLELLNLCKTLIDSSKYKHRYGNHLETRVGLLNISVVGRDCTQQQREEYYEWDNYHQDRLRICDALNSKFPELESSAGGQISIDIHEKGKNKSQIRDKIQGVIHFFGDKTQPGGNDYPIARVLRDPDKVYQVDNWQHTLKLLQQMD